MIGILWLMWLNVKFRTNWIWRTHEKEYLPATHLWKCSQLRTPNNQESKAISTAWQISSLLLKTLRHTWTGTTSRSEAPNLACQSLPKEVLRSTTEDQRSTDIWKLIKYEREESQKLPSLEASWLPCSAMHEWSWHLGRRKEERKVVARGDSAWQARQQALNSNGSIHTFQQEWI